MSLRLVEQVSGTVDEVAALLVNRNQFPTEGHASSVLPKSHGAIPSEHPNAPAHALSDEKRRRSTKASFYPRVFHVDLNEKTVAVAAPVVLGR